MTRTVTASDRGDIVVEQARVEDARDLFALHLEVLAEGRYFITEPHEFAGSVEQKARLIAEIRGSGNSVFLVARNRGRVIGFVTLTGGVLRRMRHAAKLEIMVHPSARGVGAGTALMRAAIDWAVANTVLTKVGLAVFADNDRAITLYRAFGFVEEGRRVREYRMADGTYRDDVLMYRMVDQPPHGT